MQPSWIEWAPDATHFAIAWEAADGSDLLLNLHSADGKEVGQFDAAAALSEPYGTHFINHPTFEWSPASFHISYSAYAESVHEDRYPRLQALIRLRGEPEHFKPLPPGCESADGMNPSWSPSGNILFLDDLIIENWKYRSSYKFWSVKTRGTLYEEDDWDSMIVQDDVVLSPNDQMCIFKLRGNCKCRRVLELPTEKFLSAEPTKWMVMFFVDLPSNKPGQYAFSPCGTVLLANWTATLHPRFFEPVPARYDILPSSHALCRQLWHGTISKDEGRIQMQPVVAADAGQGWLMSSLAWHPYSMACLYAIADGSRTVHTVDGIEHKSTQSWTWAQLSRQGALVPCDHVHFKLTCSPDGSKLDATALGEVTLLSFGNLTQNWVYVDCVGTHHARCCS